ncbi:MAG: DNA polymerase III subunit beta [Lachnospiraceae bacterium]|nr:DNA polymerase III subunit beta [Lachnospiraceae bacterium]
MIKLILSSSELCNKVANISKVIANKNSLPALNDILFQVSENKVQLTAADMENQVTTFVSAGVEGTGVFGVDAHLLLNSLKELPEQPVDIYVDLDSCKLCIKYQNGKFDMPVRCNEEYPLCPEIKGNNSCTIKSETFHRIISKATGFVEVDELRPQLGGVYFNFGERLEVCATNGHQLIKMNTVYTGDSKGSLLLSIKACKLAGIFAGKQTDDITIRFDERNASFELADYSFVCRLVDGRYPNYNSVIPTNYKDNIIVGRSELTSALKRVMVFTNNQSCLVKFAVNGFQLKVAGVDIDYSRSAEESLCCTREGKDVTAGLKGSFVLNILNSLETDNIKMFYLSNSSAFLFEPEVSEDDFNILCLIMPMLLND